MYYNFKIMTVNKAMQRYSWRLSQGKPYQPNELDIEAYNVIATYIEEKQKKTIVDNQLFGKLYIYLFGEFVNYYNTTVNNKIPQKELHKILDKDLRTIVDEVKDRLNAKELEVCIQNEQDLKNYKPMEYEEVATNLRIMVNDAINEYQPKHLAEV